MSTPPADRLPVLPLRDTVLYPHVVMPLLVGRPASLAALESAASGLEPGADARLFLVAQREADVLEPVAADLQRVGTIARILQHVRLPNGTVKILVEGMGRARATRYAPAGDHLRATLAPIAEPLPDAAPEDAGEAELEVTARRALALFEEYVALNRRLPAELVPLVTESGSMARRAFGIAAHLAVRQSERQRLLESADTRTLLDRLLEVLAAEIELLGLERKIEQTVRGTLFRNQREFYLQEQLRAIHRELGQEDGDEVDELEARITERALPEAVEARVRREVRRLRRMPSASPESAVARNFVDWILALPWHERSDDVLDVAHARAVLDEDHYGLEDVKDRILDHIAVMGLVGRLDGPILCLVGPPGVGKTSLGRSIAKALGRKFVRMSLGGVRDESEIRGHRRTYVGAMPGRIIQGMRRAEVVNPVLLLDEIDKLGHDWRGDPASALLEVLDPEQNRTFNDHFLEVDYDLSQTFFVTTANSLTSIPDPLRDRMEIIRIPGYIEQEKLVIAERYLVPRQCAVNGVEPERVRWAPDALSAIIRGWTREAGVRDLERRLARVGRKLARRIAEEGDAAELEITVAGLPDLLGPAPFDPEDTSLEDKVGVASGLAYTSVGGEVLEIEVSAVPGRGRSQLTGTLGDVMKESASAALSYTRGRSEALGLSPDFHRMRDLHLHIPAGATPKDGPSAGVAICTAIISALTGRAVRGDVAMTGELTLRGRVLPVGGLKEKLVAAHRQGIRDVVLPAGNRRDLDKLPEDVKLAVRFHLVRTMDEVLAIALRPAREARIPDDLAGSAAPGDPIPAAAEARA